MTTSYMQIMHNRHRVMPRRQAVQSFFPVYTLPAVARLARTPKDNPPAFIPGTNVPAMGAAMSFGSYYQSTPNYYRNPVPYLSSDVGAPVPGWGVNPLVAGPPRLGVGEMTLGERIAQSTKKIDLTQRPGFQPSPSPSPSPQPGPVAPVPEDMKVPSRPPWLLPAIAALGLGALGFYGTKKGWI